MNGEPCFKTVCSEYETLLHRCKAHMDECRKASEEESFVGGGRERRQEILARLVEQYERSYAQLKNHFDNCRRCQSARGLQRYYRRVMA
jgi:hypothetical protein